MLEFVPRLDVSGLQVVLDGVVDLDAWVWVSDGSSVMSDNIRNLVWSNGFRSDLAKLEFGFIFVNWMCLVSSLNIVKHSEVFPSFVEGDNDQFTSSRLTDLNRLSK